MAAYFTSSDHQFTDHQFEPASYDGLKPATSLPFVSKSAAVAVATVLAAPPARAASAPNADDAEAENEFWAFVDSRFCNKIMANKEAKLHKKRVKAKKALNKAMKNGTDDARVPDRQRAYDTARKAYFQHKAKLQKAYARHLRESARESGSDTDYTPSPSDEEEEEEADAYYAPSDAEEPAEPAEVEDDAPAPKKSKPKFSGPAAGPVKKAPRAKPGSSTPKKLPNGCGCSCGGVRCGHATETPAIRYDKSTQRQCCNTCGLQQNKAMNFVHGDRVAANKTATTSLCWLNQCDDVRLYGFGGGHQGKKRKAAATAAAAIASVDEEDEE
jgi:hypothetical protein